MRFARLPSHCHCLAPLPFLRPCWSLARNSDQNPLLCCLAAPLPFCYVLVITYLFKYTSTNQWGVITDGLHIHTQKEADNRNGEMSCCGKDTHAS